jgi:hypothetical protein
VSLQWILALQICELNTAYVERKAVVLGVLLSWPTCGTTAETNDSPDSESLHGCTYHDAGAPRGRSTHDIPLLTSPCPGLVEHAGRIKWSGGQRTQHLRRIPLRVLAFAESLRRPPLASLTTSVLLVVHHFVKEKSHANTRLYVPTTLSNMHFSRYYKIIIHAFLY